MSLWTALTSNHVETVPGAEDPRLTGRTYAIPFATVWDASVRLAAGGLKGWQMVRWDDQEGTLEAHVRGVLLALPALVTIQVSLDENAQTRVDLEAKGEGSRGDLGANARRTGRFFAALDRELGANGSNILTASAPIS